MGTTTVAQLVADARQRIVNLSVDQVAERLADPEVVVIDLREAAELNGGVIGGAVHAPRGMLEFWADPASPYHREPFDPARSVILYCASGGRSALAADTLRRFGYRDVCHLDGGIAAWREAGMPLVPRADGGTS